VKSVRHETKNSEYVLYGIARNIFQAESTLNRRIAAAVSDLAPNHGRPPSQWQEQIGDIQRFEVAANSQEWQDVLKSLQTTLPQAKLCSLQRYQNKPMWNLFAATRENVRQALKREDVTKLLFHGTRQTSPDMIFQGGFDRNFGSAGMWGPGQYFAVNASYSHDYRHTRTDGKFQMFLAEVVTGDISVQHTPDSKLRMAPIRTFACTHGASCNQAVCRGQDRRFDSIEGYTAGSVIYILYRDNTSYPSYLLTYTV